MDWEQVFQAAVPYQEFLDLHGTADHRMKWQRVYDQVRLTAQQSALLASFTRRMNVLCVAGAWCGDCVQQCPVFPHFANASKAIDLRFLDRDVRPDLRDALAINGGHRVPVLVFLSEDFLECGRYGERTLSRYRDLVKTQLGPSCPTGIVNLDSSLLTAVTTEWLAEFERVQWMLLLSPRLRIKHGD